jgi:hypothetical protein
VWRTREPRPIDVNAEALVDLTNGHVIEFDYVLHWGSVTSLRLSPTPDVREQPVRQFDRWLRFVRLVFADREPMEFPGFQIDPRCPSIGSNDAVQIGPGSRAREKADQSESGEVEYWPLTGCDLLTLIMVPPQRHVVTFAPHRPEQPRCEHSRSGRSRTSLSGLVAVDLRQGLMPWR